MLHYADVEPVWVKVWSSSRLASTSVIGPKTPSRLSLDPFTFRRRRPPASKSERRSIRLSPALPTLLTQYGSCGSELLLPCTVAAAATSEWREIEALVPAANFTAVSPPSPLDAACPDPLCNGLQDVDVICTRLLGWSTEAELLTSLHAIGSWLLVWAELIDVPLRLFASIAEHTGHHHFFC